MNASMRELRRAFLREPAAAKLALPVEFEGVRILSLNGSEVFSAYVPNPKGAVFMVFIERTLGKEVTTAPGIQSRRSRGDRLHGVVRICLNS